MTVQRVAVVTGANRGIGLEICRQLGRRGGIRVFLTARNEAKGNAAARKLRDEGLDVEFYPLDVTSEQSVKTFAGWLEGTCKRCDILVNNAGIVVDPRGSRFLDYWSTRCARAGSGRTWAGQARRGRWSRAPTRRYGWRRCRMTGRMADFSATASPSHGDGCPVTNALIWRRVSIRRWVGAEVYRLCQ
jgi:NAD(P)-dependent dehydrogenase (short-subunit alcohol dehydrogenase family)